MHNSRDGKERAVADSSTGRLLSDAELHSALHADGVLNKEILASRELMERAESDPDRELLPANALRDFLREHI